MAKKGILASGSGRVSKSSSDGRKRSGRGRDVGRPSDALAVWAEANRLSPEERKGSFDSQYVLIKQRLANPATGYPGPHLRTIERILSKYPPLPRSETGELYLPDGLIIDGGTF